MQEIDGKNSQPVKVYIRQRPMNKSEVESRHHNVVQHFSPREISVKSGYNEKNYNYDHVFGEEATQAEVYETVVGPLINSVISGYNCTVFAYGQSGTGKTHTIVGSDPLSNTVDILTDPSVGMIPRAAIQLFSELYKLNPKTAYTVRVSFIEIFNEEVRDLLKDLNLLRVYDDPENKGAVCMKGITEVTVRTARDVCEWLKIGIMKRQSTSTNLNARSSRSHTIFTILINTRELTERNEVLIKNGKLYLVDLAGSENVGKSAAADGRAGSINKSLLTFGKVIKALAQKVQHVPYRDSKLTRILQDSLGGNTKTCMIATMSPSSNAWDETISTLDYASVARKVANCPHVNINRNQANFLKDLQDEINELAQELKVARSGRGFYMSNRAYEKMNEGIQENHEKICELLQRIAQLEQYKRDKEQQYRKLETSFQETKEHLDAVAKELEEKKLKIESNRRNLSYMKSREKQLENTANVLLEVCKTSTKQEEIFYTKYEKQCDATVKNGIISEELIAVSRKTLNDVKQLSKTHLGEQKTCTKTAEDAINRLMEGYREGLESLSDLSREMKTEAETQNYISVKEICKNETTDYSEDNTKNFFNDVYDRQLREIEKQEVMIKSLKDLKHYTECKNMELATRSEKCYKDLLNKRSKSDEFVTSTRDILLNIHELIGDRKRVMNDQIAKVESMKAAILDSFEKLEEGQNELLQNGSKVKKTAEGLLQTVQQRIRENEKGELQNSIDNYFQYQADARRVQISKADLLLEKVDEVRSEAAAQIEADTSALHKYWSGMILTITENYSWYNQKFRSFISAWLDRANIVKNNLFQSVESECKTLQASIGQLSQSNEKYNTEMREIIEAATEDLKNLENNIISVVHVGDTPAKKSYEYPKHIEESVSSSLFERFNNSTEENE